MNQTATFHFQLGQGTPHFQHQQHNSGVGGIIIEILSWVLNSLIRDTRGITRLTPQCVYNIMLIFGFYWLGMCILATVNVSGDFTKQQYSKLQNTDFKLHRKAPLKEIPAPSVSGAPKRIPGLLLVWGGLSCQLMPAPSRHQHGGSVKAIILGFTNNK